MTTTVAPLIKFPMVICGRDLTGSSWANPRLLSGSNYLLKLIQIRRRLCQVLNGSLEILASCLFAKWTVPNHRPNPHSLLMDTADLRHHHHHHHQSSPVEFGDTETPQEHASRSIARLYHRLSPRDRPFRWWSNGARRKCSSHSPAWNRNEWP